MRHALPDAAHRARLGPAAAGVLVVGVGNAYRHDDAVGLVAARRLGAVARGAVTLREASGEGAALMEVWKGAGAVIVIDAVSSGAPAGTIHRVDAAMCAVPPGWGHYSSHAFAVAEAIELARALNRLPPRLIVYGVEGKRFDAGVGLSPEVAAAVETLVRRGHAEIGRLGAGRASRSGRGS
jgi:hydrogenase maturation protease